MTARPIAGRALSTLLVSALLAACGGGDEGGSPAATQAADGPRAHVLKGGDCSGSCTGGGGTPVPGATNPLPTSAPAPDIVYRESFGPGPQGLRPKGGKGDMRSTFIGTTLGGFWTEWPGNKNNAWITGSGEATWKFTAGSNGGPNFNTNELPSPLEVDQGFGVVAGQVFSDVSDGTSGGLPTALLPVTWPTTAWSVSIDSMLWVNTASSYVALGLTDSSATLSNLLTASTVTVLIRRTPLASTLDWELWKSGTPRVLLASGTVDELGLNELRLSYDPVAKQLAVQVNGTPGGTFAVDIGRPRYAAFEGIGMVDNFVVRKLPGGAL